MSSDFGKALFRRWFIEYNPLYLLSACCVLVGVSELSQGLSHSAYGAVAVAAVAELYAWALIGSAAFLSRVGLRRPAVMLALLVAIYQCDPTLHTETCAYLGRMGALAGAAWFASFVGKAFALARAMQVRISRSALAVSFFGGLGVLLFPLFLRQINTVSLSSLVALWVFVLFACGLWGGLVIESRLRLDDWGRTVFRRTVRAIWAIFAVLTLAHVWFWTTELELEAALIVPVLLLLSTRWMPRERSAWLAVAGAFVSGVVMRPFFATIALMAAITLALRAFRQPIEPPSEELGACDLDAGVYEAAVGFGFAERSERMRLLSGSLSALYLSAWTSNSTRGALPAHLWWLDTLLTAALLGMVWGLRAYVALVPLALSYLHLGVRAGTLSLPKTRAQWGVSEVGLGFTLLAAAVLISWHSKGRRGEGDSSFGEPREDSSSASGSERA